MKTTMILVIAALLGGCFATSPVPCSNEPATVADCNAMEATIMGVCGAPVRLCCGNSTMWTGVTEDEVVDCLEAMAALNVADAATACSDPDTTTNDGAGPAACQDIKNRTQGCRVF